MLNLEQKSSVEIKDSGFTLRPFTMDLVGPRYLSWLHDPEVNRFLVGAHSGISIDQARDYCQQLVTSDKDIFLAILANPNNQHLGNVRLGPIDVSRHIGNFSIMIGEEKSRGIGLGTQIFRSCMKYYFEEIGVNRICVDVIKNHHAAVRIYQKSKLQVDQESAREIFLNGSWQKLLMMYIDKESNWR